MSNLDFDLDEIIDQSTTSDFHSPINIAEDFASEDAVEEQPKKRRGRPPGTGKPREPKAVSETGEKRRHLTQDVKNQIITKLVSGSTVAEVMAEFEVEEHRVMAVVNKRRSTYKEIIEKNEETPEVVARAKRILEKLPAKASRKSKKVTKVIDPVYDDQIDELLK